MICLALPLARHLQQARLVLLFGGFAMCPRFRSSFILVGFGLVSLAWLALAACSQHQSVASSAHRETDADEGHGLHVVNSERLRLIMKQLRALDLEAICREMEVGRQPDRRIEEVAEMASALASDARLIPALFKDTEMTSESRRVFDQLAARLQNQASQLGDLARSQNARRIQSKLDELVQTCNECHQSFRGPTIAMLLRPASPARS